MQAERRGRLITTLQNWQKFTKKVSMKKYRKIIDMFYGRINTSYTPRLPSSRQFGEMAETDHILLRLTEDTRFSQSIYDLSCI